MSKPEFVYTTYIKSTPEKVWEAIVNPEFAAQYWGGLGIVSDLKKGSKWRLVDTKDESIVKCIGEVVESTPPERLTLTWADPSNEADVSRVTFEIGLSGDLVRLDVIHGDFKPGSDMLEKISGGWPLVLSSLKSLLETGKSIDVLSVKGGSCGSSQPLKEAKAG
ncbi:MAG: polyketide cyclase [Alphaproteobacteria bacterium]|nr:polyketide cyclase [Alphaproteobacteria bacterium]